MQLPDAASVGAVPVFALANARCCGGPVVGSARVNIQLVTVDCG